MDSDFEISDLVDGVGRWPPLAEAVFRGWPQKGFRSEEQLEDGQDG